MDEGKEYIEMCEKATDIQEKKYYLGFKESDFVFDGKITRVVGHDFLGVENLYKKEKQLYYRFALTKDLDRVSFDKQDIPLGEINVKSGEYIIETLYKGIWLPRQDQLQDMIITKLNAGQLSMYFEDWRTKQLEDRRIELIDYSMEQLWLAFVMLKKFGKEWKGNEWLK